jgi:histidinol-phosphate aminotransferase
MSINFEQLPHAGIQSLVPYNPGKSIEELAREKGISDIIKLASNENPLGCSPLALIALRSMPPQVVATYPSPLNHPLMPKLAAKLKINRDQLFLSNGSDYLFNILLNCFALNTHKHILTHEYAFSTYAIQAKSLNIPVKTVAINNDWHININSLIRECSEKTGLIFLANPNNPTGLLTSQSDIKYLLEHIPESTLLVLDEAYYEFAADQMHENSLNWLSEHPNLVITRTFSKIYGMAGLRLGYAIAHPSIISILQKVQLPFAVNQAALVAAHAALDDEEFIRLSLQTNAEGMVQMRAGLDKLNFNYLPSSCNFLTFDCKEECMPLFNYLLDQGIIVRPLHAYQMNNYIRVSIGTRDQNKRFLNSLTDYYELK